MPFTFSRRSESNLVMVHPDLVRVARRGLILSPYDFAVTEGLRMLTRQRELVRRGVSKTMNSKHLLQTDGWAHAFDVVAVGDLNMDGVVDVQDRSITWDKEIYGRIAKAMYAAAKEFGVKIRWGGEFKSLFDGPHFELGT